MTTVNIVTVTKAQDFPAGTVDTPFTIILVDASGTTVDSASSADGTASFSPVAPGDYTVNVSKNGVSVSSPVSVPQPLVSLQVPVSVTVTLA